MYQNDNISWSTKGNEKLEAFLSCNSDEILFGGSAGSGKSEGLLIAALGDEKCGIFNSRAWKVLILRRTFPELEGSLIQRSKELLSGKGKYDNVKHRWTFYPAGGLLQFGHIKNEDDVYKYQSQEYNLIEFDELTHFSEKIYLYLFSRLRTVDEKIRVKVKSATNPGNIGHAWVKKRFIDDKDKFKIYNSEKTTVEGMKTTWSQCFIPANVFDNKILMKNDPMYIRRLMELPEIEREKLLYGNWEIFTGQFFSEFSEDHLCDDFDFPIDWSVWISMDWGYSSHCGILFFTEDPETGDIYCFDEIYVKQKTVDEVADMIKERLGKRIKNVVGQYADRRIKLRDESFNISTQEKFNLHGLYFRLANDKRDEGWHRVRELLMKDKEGLYHFHIFRRCYNFIRTIPEQIFDKNNNEDIDKRGEDHLVDALRYYAISRKSKLYDEENISKNEYQTNPVTGYIGRVVRNDEIRELIRIPRLRMEAGRNYYWDKVVNE